METEKKEPETAEVADCCEKGKCGCEKYKKFLPQVIGVIVLIVLIAGGDVMLGRTVNTRSQKNKDFVWAFKNIAREFSSADISLVNLEAPIIQNCPQTDTGMIFCAPPEHIEGIIAAGIDIAHLANNHIYNQGKEGRDSTISILKQNGISPIGFETAIKEVKGVRFGFIGSNAVEEIDENLLAHQIKDLRQKVAVLIVSFHWGTEYTPLSNQYQKKLAHLTEIVGLAGIIISLFVFVLSALQGHGTFPSFLLAISLAVAVVPGDPECGVGKVRQPESGVARALCQ